MQRLSIVMPALNEAANIVGALERLQPLRARGHEVIVVDGGSEDGTVKLAQPLADRVLEARRGRARQMNAGAEHASGDVLLFLHADTRLPEDADRLIAERLPGTALAWGRFDVVIEGRPLMLKVIAAAMNLRSRVTGVCTGDQGIFVHRELFQRIGGYPPIELMEDIALTGMLRRRARPICLARRVITSGRRWERRGVWRTMALMWWLRLRYFFGASPAHLRRLYEGRRT
jgi:rSAM/selenodomain-associated transferase 2